MMEQSFWNNHVGTVMVEQSWWNSDGGTVVLDRVAKKVILTGYHLGKLKLTLASPNIISTSPENVLMSRLISQFFCNLNS